MVGIFLVVRPRVPADDCVRFNQPNNKNESAYQLVQRHIGHAVVAVIQVKVSLAAQHPRHLRRVAFVTEYILADRPRRTESGRIAHVVVRGADEVSRIALFNQFGDGARRLERDIVGMRLKREEHFAFVRLP